MELISMTDFVLEQNEKINENFKKNILMTQGETLDELNNFIDIITNYANFLKKPLKLGYFIPCDKNDVPLEEPINFEVWERLHFKNGKTEKGTIGFKEHEKYQEAKQRVLFEVFEYDGLYIEYKVNNLNRFFKDELRKGTIEDLLIQIDDKIKLTETAKKEIGIL